MLEFLNFTQLAIENMMLSACQGSQYYVTTVISKPIRCQSVHRLKGKLQMIFIILTLGGT